jgi:hypothetical protein
LLINQQPSLVSHIQKRYDQAGKILFEDKNAWVALSDMFTNILQDPSLRSTYIIIDALDECIADLPMLLDFVIQKSSLSPRVKWLVSSRNWPTIEEQLEKAENKVKLHLELNTTSVSAAVRIYIRYKVDQLAQDKQYDEETRKTVFDHLTLNVDNTFLWVALVYQNLKEIDPWEVAAALKEFPPGLNTFYGQMIKKIKDSRHASLFKRILASITIVYRPVTLKELISLVDLPQNVSRDLKWLKKIIGLCGSFLTIREDTIYFVHQSAKDYLLEVASDQIFPSGIEETQQEIFRRSLEAMSKILQRNVYKLHALGFPIKEVKERNEDPLAAVGYSCVYWVDHLCELGLNKRSKHNSSLQDVVDKFLRTKYIYWLEAMSFLKEIPKAVLSMRRLQQLVDVSVDRVAMLLN